MLKKVLQQKARRQHRTRTKIISHKGDRFRLSVSRSNRYLYLQIIDDNAEKTVVAVHTKEVPNVDKMSRMEQAEALGKLIAKKALAKNVKKVVYDRGRFKYHGLVRAAAEGARKEGLKF